MDTGITDVTGLARTVRRLLDAGDEAGAAALLPGERPYPLPEPIAARLGAAEDLPEPLTARLGDA